MAYGFKPLGGLVFLSNPKSSSLSIRDQLLKWLLVPVVSLCVLSTTIAYKLAESHADQSFDAFLLNSADSIAARLSRNEHGVVVADLPPAAQAIIRHNGSDKFYYQIVDSTGRRLTGDAILPPPRLMTFRGAKFRYFILDGERVRICRIPTKIPPSTDEIWIQVAETLNSRQRLQRQIFLSIVVPQLALVVLASLSVWFGIKRGLIPLTNLGGILASRSQLDLSPVELERTPPELAPVVRSLNAVFLTANKHIQLQRQFIANAAHQLRTPVTALKTYVDYAERINTDSALGAVLGHIDEATSRTVHLIQRLLVLARTEGSRKGPEPVDMIAAVNSAAAVLVHEALQKKIEMSFEIPDFPVYVAGNQSDLEELVSNLLENAIKYTPEAGFIWVKVESSDAVILTIEDSGHGVPDTEKERIFERFYRGASSNGSGCGLGLAIVSEIIATLAASLELSDRPGGGAVFCVKFPRLPKELLLTDSPVEAATIAPEQDA